MEKPVRSKKRKRIKKRITTFPVRFFLLQLVLPISDTVTDTLTGYSYYKRGHVYWASCIWLLMSGPLVLKSLIEILKSMVHCTRKIRCTRRTSAREEYELKSESEQVHQSGRSNVSTIGENVVLEFAATIPLFQPFVHLYFANQLQEADIGMDEAKETYKDIERKVTRKWKWGIWNGGETL